MRKKKRLVALLMAFVMCFAFSGSAMAADTVEPEKHIVEIAVPSNSTYNAQSDIYTLVEDPYVLEYNRSIYSHNFTSPHKYCAFESYATGASGTYYVALAEDDIYPIVSHTNDVNAGKEKTDWVTVTAGGSYSYIIRNYTSGTITVYITFYSWA